MYCSTSRFAREGNALFGEWTWQKDTGIKPLEKFNANYSVKSFTNITESLNSYILNLNRHHAYKEMRSYRYKKITNGKASGIISFGIKGGSDAGAKFIDALQMILRVLSMGDAKSLACHPASTLHRQLTPAQKALAGVSEDLVRISVGIEHIDDIISDVKQAIKASQI